LSMNCSIAMESLSYRRSVGTMPDLPDTWFPGAGRPTTGPLHNPLVHM
jgi:hypothetical protein